MVHEWIKLIDSTPLAVGYKYNRWPIGYIGRYFHLEPEIFFDRDWFLAEQYQPVGTDINQMSEDLLGFILNHLHRVC